MPESIAQENWEKAWKRSYRLGMLSLGLLCTGDSGGIVHHDSVKMIMIGRTVSYTVKWTKVDLSLGCLVV